jgi:hypothetical protein
MLVGGYQAFVISRSVYVTGFAICSTSDATTWHQFWGVAQLVAILIAAVMIVRVWRDSMQPSDE